MRELSLALLADLPVQRATRSLGFNADNQLVLGPTVLQSFFPARGTGNDTLAIQAALDAASAAGAGIVDLGNFTWNITGKLTHNSATTTVVGAGATLDWGSVSAALETAYHITQPVGAAHRGRNIVHHIRGVRFRGTNSDRIGRGIYLHNPTNPNQETSQIAFYDCNVGGFNNGLEIADNSYICKWYHCSFDSAASTNVVRLTANNNGESMAFYGCTFGNSPRALQLQGPNQDFYFYGCSFDYITEYVIFQQSGIVEFHGCHFEANYTNRSMFQIQDNASMSFFGGVLGFLGASNSADYVFQCWGNNSGRYYLNGVAMGGLKYAQRLCDKPECIEVTGSYSHSGAKNLDTNNSTIVVDAVSSNFFSGVLSRNTTLGNPVNETGNRRLTWAIKQAASGGPYTLSFGNKFVWQGGAPTMPTAANAVLAFESLYVPSEDRWYARLV